MTETLFVYLFRNGDAYRAPRGLKIKAEKLAETFKVENKQLTFESQILHNLSGKPIDSIKGIIDEGAYVLIPQGSVFLPDAYRKVYKTYLKLEKPPSKKPPPKVKQPTLPVLQTKKRDVTPKRRKRKHKWQTGDFYPKPHHCVREEMEANQKKQQKKDGARRKRFLGNPTYKEAPRHTCKAIEKLKPEPRICLCEPWMKCHPERSKLKKRLLLSTQKKYETSSEVKSEEITENETVDDQILEDTPQSVEEDLLCDGEEEIVADEEVNDVEPSEGCNEVLATESDETEEFTLEIEEPKENEEKLDIEINTNELYPLKPEVTEAADAQEETNELYPVAPEITEASDAQEETNELSPISSKEKLKTVENP